MIRARKFLLCHDFLVPVPGFYGLDDEVDDARRVFFDIQATLHLTAADGHTKLRPIAVEAWSTRVDSLLIHPIRDGDATSAAQLKMSRYLIGIIDAALHVH
jgi:hypothetical protein